MLRRASALTLALVLVTLFSTTTWALPRSEHADAPLVDGLSVPRGTRLIGAVVPEFLGNTQLPDGRFAMLEVTTDAVTVMNRFRRQALRHGYEQMSSPKTGCVSESADISCVAAYVSTKRWFTLRVRSALRATLPSQSP